MKNDKKWFQKAYKRILVDMHIPDWNDEFLRDFDPENYADMMQLAGIDTAEIYSSSCLGLCFWPTKTAFPHRIVTKGRDLLGETIQACKKRGIDVQIYTNFWNRTAYDVHPEWRIIRPDGKGTCDGGGRFGQCCHNTGYADFFVQMCEELADAYDCVGYWVDMVGIYNPCICPSCRKRFMEETGFQQLPRFADWSDPAFIALNNCMNKWHGELMNRIKAALQKNHPERTVTFQSARLTFGRGCGISDDFLNASDYLAGDFTGDKIQQSVITKTFSLLTKNRPMEFMTPRCEDLSYHTTERPIQNLTMRAYAAIANQCSFTLIDAIDPSGRLDRRFYEHARDVNATYAQYESYLDSDSEPMADVGIFYSIESICDPDWGPVPYAEFMGRGKDPFRTIADWLGRKHIPFKFVRAEQLDSVPVVFLSDCCCLTEDDCKAIRKYVEKGGKILADYRTSLFSDTTGRLGNFQLAEVLGIDYAGTYTQRVTYIQPIDEQVMDGVVPDYPLMLNGSQVNVVPYPETEVLAYITLPISLATDNQRFGSAISNPPMRPTRCPAITRHAFGKGTALYVAGKIEDNAFDAHKRALVSLLDDLLGKRSLVTNAHPCADFTLFSQPKKKRIVLSITNQPTILPPVPLHDLWIELTLPKGFDIKNVTTGPDHRDCKWTRENDKIRIEIDTLDAFAIFAING